MKTVITYGTFDMFHTGHLRLLERAKQLGDKLIVGVTSDDYDLTRGKLNVMQNCQERMESVRRTGLADMIIVEEEEGQKQLDIRKYKADIFAIGSDWVGKFDYLKEDCDVVYLERTQGVSSTDIRKDRYPIIRIGIAGSGRIAERFLKESKYVSGTEVYAVYGRREQHITDFAHKHEIPVTSTDYEHFLEAVDAVYIAVPHHLHADLARRALQAGKHVLCEKPMALTQAEAEELYTLARQKGCILMEAIKTAYAPGFGQLVRVAKSGLIGHIAAVDAGFTKLVTNTSLREYDAAQAGGALTELGSYPLLAIAKLLGTRPVEVRFQTLSSATHHVDIFTRVHFTYPGAIATATAGIGVKREGDLCIAGTKGYIYVPAPWWKTEYFEIRSEDSSKCRKYLIKFEEDGLRYEISAFLKKISGKTDIESSLSEEESVFIASVLEQFRKGTNVHYLATGI